MAGMSPEARSLWCVNTKSSAVKCTLHNLAAGWYELRLFQDQEVVLREQFTSSEAAQGYADQLYRQLAKLKKPLSPRHVMHRAS
jgi:hypothetical protein